MTKTSDKIAASFLDNYTESSSIRINELAEKILVRKVAVWTF